MENTHSSPATLWAHAFERVRHTISSPIVWLAMQAAEPIVVDGNFFVAGLTADKQYLADNLRTFEVVTVIEEALHQAAGHILAFRLIEGTSKDDWEAVKQKEAAAHASQEQAEESEAGIPPVYPAERRRKETSRDVYPTWEKLGEHLNRMYKTSPSIKFPHGQARFIMEAVKYLSDTIDLLIPGFGQTQDDVQDRALARFLERFSALINLDPIFLSLELYRYRQSQGE